MKKSIIVIIAIVLVLAVVFVLVKINSSKKTPSADDPIVGGYQHVEDMNLTPELIEIFDKAVEGYSEVNYSAVMLEATQVVAGINYKFLADGIKTTEPMMIGTYYVYVNKDLEGNVSVLDIEVIEEHELKKFTPEDDTLNQEIPIKEK